MKEEKGAAAAPANPPVVTALNQTSNPATETILRGAIGDIGSGKPNYDQMTPDAADIVRGTLPRLQAALDKFGALQSLAYQGSVEPAAPLVYEGKPQKLEQYEATYAAGTISWRIFVTSNGKIGRLVPFAVKDSAANR